MSALPVDTFIGIVGGVVFLIVAVGLLLTFHEAGSSD